MARILIASFGLTPHNMRLMPWRTVLEVADGLRVKGHTVTVLSIADKGRPPIEAPERGIFTIQRQRAVDMRQKLLALAGRSGFDVMFIPVSWSRNRLMRDLLAEFDGIRIAYMPGSVFELGQLLPLLGKMPLRSLLPYLAQATFPSPLLRRSLTDLGVGAVITNSDYSRDHLARRIAQPVVTIAPGRDPVISQPEGGSKSARLHAEAPYFLFMGPPLAIRGVFVLLDAYLKVANDPDMPPLLCLFRSDAHLDMPKLKSMIEQRWSNDKLHFVWDSLEPSALQSHIEHAMAIVMPFLVVPSEIPLAVYEAAGMGKTVITTRPHGTGDFVSKFGETVKVGNVSALASALLRTARAARNGPSSGNGKALTAHEGLETWQATADRWEMLAIEMGVHAK